MIRRIDQQFRVNRLMSEAIDLSGLENGPLKRYMRNYLEIITTVSTVLSKKSGSPEVMRQCRQFWAYQRDIDGVDVGRAKATIFDGVAVGVPLQALGNEEAQPTGNDVRHLRKGDKQQVDHGIQHDQGNDAKDGIVDHIKDGNAIEHSFSFFRHRVCHHSAPSSSMTLTTLLTDSTRISEIMLRNMPIAVESEKLPGVRMPRR